LQDAGIDPNNLNSSTGNPGVPPGVDPAWWAKVVGQGAVGAKVGHFASGGMDIPAGRYVVGEGGPEIMDVPGGSNIYAYGTMPGMAGGGELHVHNHIYLDGREMANQLGPHLVRQIRMATAVRR